MIGIQHGLHHSSIDKFPVVKTSEGLVKGAKRISLYGASYYSFQKIPYAEPPIGELRFRSPKPVGVWHGIKDCTRVGVAPLQKNRCTKELKGSEDCLYLNVYVKTFRSAQMLPCMVFIYGGSYEVGEASCKLFGPDYFMQEEVVLMIPNYRLGPLGFLSLTDPAMDIPGNAGLKDQLLALRWFQKNCVCFNGDPTNITLFGNGVGGASVHYHTLNTASEGLFHKAIIMSSPLFNEGALVPRSDYAFRLAKLTGYEGQNVDKKVMEHLMEVKGKNLVGVDVRTEEEILKGIQFVFGPMVEPYKSDNCVICTNPDLMMETSWGNEIPVLIGGVSFEGLFMLKRTKKRWTKMKEHPEMFVPMQIRHHKSCEENKQTGQAIEEEYALRSDGNLKCRAAMLNYCEFFSYKYFWVGIHRFALARLEHSKAPTYIYRFDFDSPTFNMFRISLCGPKIRGVCHGDELCYLFRQSVSPRVKRTSEEFQTIQRMIALWTSFAKNSDPNCCELDPVAWKPISKEHPSLCLNIRQQSKLMELPEAVKFPFWDSLYASVDQLCLQVTEVTSEASST